MVNGQCRRGAAYEFAKPNYFCTLYSSYDAENGKRVVEDGSTVMVMVMVMVTVGNYHRHPDALKRTAIQRDRASPEGT